MCHDGHMCTAAARGGKYSSSHTLLLPVYCWRGASCVVKKLPVISDRAAAAHPAAPDTPLAGPFTRSLLL